MLHLRTLGGLRLCGPDGELLVRRRNALAVLAVLAVQWGDFSGTPDWIRVLYPTGLGICCASLLPWASRLTAGEGPFARAVRFVSLVSYSLYLSHVPLRIVLYQLCFVRLHLPTNWGGEAVFQIVCWSSYLAFAGAVYRWFEKPMMDLRDRRTVLAS